MAHLQGCGIFTHMCITVQFHCSTGYSKNKSTEDGSRIKIQINASVILIKPQ